MGDDTLAMRRDRIVMCMMPACYVRTASPWVTTPRGLLRVRSRASRCRQDAWPPGGPRDDAAGKSVSPSAVATTPRENWGLASPARRVVRRIRDARRVRQDTTGELTTPDASGVTPQKISGC